MLQKRNLVTMLLLAGARVEGIAGKIRHRGEMVQVGGDNCKRKLQALELDWQLNGLIRDPRVMQFEDLLENTHVQETFSASDFLAMAHVPS